MTSSKSSSDKKGKRRISPILFGVITFFVILAATIFNSFRECVWSAAFPPAWRVAFNNGMARARVNRPEGIKLMEAALEDCEKSSGGNNEKAKLFYDYGVWNFNSIALPNRFATAKKAYARCVALTDSNDRKAMALEMMADCDYFAGTAAADSEKNGEQAWKYRHEPGGNQDPAALWGTVEAMGRAYMVCGHYDKAAAAFKQAMDMAEKNNLWKGDAAPQSAGDLACAYALQGDRQSGDKTFFDSIERYDKLIGACSEPAERVIAAYARALMKTGDQESAAKLVSRLDDPDSLNNIGPFFKAFFI